VSNAKKIHVSGEPMGYGGRLATKAQEQGLNVVDDPKEAEIVALVSPQPMDVKNAHSQGYAKIVVVTFKNDPPSWLVFRWAKFGAHNFIISARDVGVDLRRILEAADWEW